MPGDGGKLVAWTCSGPCNTIVYLFNFLRQVTLSRTVVTETLSPDYGNIAGAPPGCYDTAADLAVAISNGDAKAEAEFYRRYYQSLFFILERKTNDPEAARDLCHEAFCVLLERLRGEPLADPGKVVTFLHMIGINLYIAEVRKAIRRKTYANQTLVNQMPDVTQNQLNKLLKERRALAVQYLIESLPNPRDRQLLDAWFIQELDKAEICEAMGLGERHFDKVLYRAKQRFRDLVEKKPV
jgi:RNA polymerase sigma-70 factor (ECF subfamily)